MIKNYDRDTGSEYRNIFQVVWLFLIIEYHEILKAIGAFNEQTLEYDHRRHVWFIAVVFMILAFLASVIVIAISAVAITSIMIGK